MSIPNDPSTRSSGTPSTEGSSGVSSPASAPQPAAVASGPALYLIPCFLDEQALAPLPAYLLDAIRACQVFFVENERSARRYCKMLWKEMVIDDYEWIPIHKAEEEVRTIFRQKLKEGKTIGLISEAGCPGIADPGQLLTAAAHEAGVSVRPLVGPSSILLALMGSGLNGQQFRFSGYLPVDNAGRTKALRDLEAESQRLHCTQVFIETPYRNNQLLETILQTARPTTHLCIAADLTGPGEFIRTHTIAEWRRLRDVSTATAQPNSAPPVTAPKPTASSPKEKAARESFPNLHKRPTIFCLLA